MCGGRPARRPAAHLAAQPRSQQTPLARPGTWALCRARPASQRAPRCMEPASGAAEAGVGRPINCRHRSKVARLHGPWCTRRSPDGAHRPYRQRRAQAPIRVAACGFTRRRTQAPTSVPACGIGSAGHGPEQRCRVRYHQRRARPRTTLSCAVSPAPGTAPKQRRRVPYQQRRARP